MPIPFGPGRGEGSLGQFLATTFGVRWTVNTTDQRAIFGVVGYQFHRKFSLYAGLNGLPGTRSMFGSHPYWLGNDRVMADEFFRPFFGSGVWAQGEPIPGLWYSAMVANNSSALSVTASQLDRKFSTGGSVWWMPTTKEFGPRGAYGDWEMHEKVATRSPRRNPLSSATRCRRSSRSTAPPPRSTATNARDSATAQSTWSG